MNKKSNAAAQHATSVTLGARLIVTSQQLEALASQLHRANRTLLDRCQLTQLVMDAGKPVTELTVAELLPLVAKVAN